MDQGSIVLSPVQKQQKRQPHARIALLLIASIALLLIASVFTAGQPQKMWKAECSM